MELYEVVVAALSTDELTKLTIEVDEEVRKLIDSFPIFMIMQDRLNMGGQR